MPNRLRRLLGNLAASDAEVEAAGLQTSATRPGADLVADCNGGVIGIAVSA